MAKSLVSCFFLTRGVQLSAAQRRSAVNFDTSFAMHRNCRRRLFAPHRFAVIYVPY